MRALVLTAGFAFVVALPPAPPKPENLVAEYTINLDSPPEQRWSEVGKDYADYITNTVTRFKKSFNEKTRTAMVAAIKSSLFDEYAHELQGLASASSNSYDDIIVANMYYELSRITGSGGNPGMKMCTSIVAQHANGTMYFGHNFDYPSFFAPGLINAKFVKGGKMLYQGLVAAGTVGIITGVSPGSHAIAIDERVDVRDSPTSMPLEEAVKATQNGAYIFIHLTRKALEVASSFDAAVNLLQQKPGMISPGYFILAGSKPSQGAVVTGNTSAFNNDVWKMKDDTDGWFMVETNFDHWRSPLDGRRDAARKGLKAIGATDISPLGIWDVLSTPPVYAHGTLTTHLIDIAAGTHKAYHRHVTEASGNVVV